jgi:hypothetical protein
MEKNQSTNPPTFGIFASQGVRCTHTNQISSKNETMVQGDKYARCSLGSGSDYGSDPGHELSRVE